MNKQSISKSLRLVAVLGSAVVLAACGSTKGSSYQQGVAGNVKNYSEFSTVMHSQQNTLNSCFNAAGSTKDPSAVAMCAVLAAGTNAQQTLAGQPEAIRIAKSPEEVTETIMSKGLDAAVKIFGFKQVANVMSKGFDAAAKDPLVEIVRPEVVKPEIVFPFVVQ